MDRRTMVMMILSLLLSAALLLLPVNAENTAGPDTSGFDWDIGKIATGLLINDMSVLVTPPGWQWDAKRYMDEGHKCAANCELQKQDYLQRAMASQVKPGAFTADEIEKLKNLKPQSPSFYEGGGIDVNKWKELGVTSSQMKMDLYCDCARKNYNAALALTDKKDYEGQAGILESASGLYATLGMTKEQEKVENLALGARAAAAAHKMSLLPLPAWAAVCGIVGGVILLQRRRK